jgi:adenosylhomocysteine nucleosidase
MTRVAIIAAMPGELKPLVRGWAHERRGNVQLWRWNFDEGEWVAACGGAGVNAATRALAEVEKDGPSELVISVGWAGALTPALAAGRAYSVSGVIDARTGERFQVSLRSGTTEALKGHGFSRAAEAPNNGSALAAEGMSAAGSTFPQGLKPRESLPASDSGAKAPPLQNNYRLVTSPIVADEAEKQRLATTYKADLVDMEAAAIARLAQMRGIPFYCIKGVSDGFHDKLPDFNRFIRPGGQFDMAGMVLFSILRPWYWPSLVRMGENSSKASQSIREALLDFLDERAYIGERNGYPNHKH